MLGFAIMHARETVTAQRRGSAVAVLLCFGILAAATPSPAQFALELDLDIEESRVTMNLLESWSNIYAGRQTVFHAVIRSKSTFAGSLAWRFHSRGTTIAEDQKRINAAAFAPVTIDIPLPVPDLKTGSIAGATLDVVLREDDFEAPTAQQSRPLWIFHENPFRLRTRWTDDLRLSLYDPKSRTATKLQTMGIPFTRLHDLDPTLSQIENVLIVGEGLALTDYSGLFDTLIRLADQGVSCILLAPLNGEISLPGIGDVDLPRPAGLAFRDTDVIHRFDPRLDADYWPRDGELVAMRLRLSGERGAVFGHIQELGDGWPWIEMDYGKDKGTLLVCGLRIIEKWEETPAPRYLFMRMLEHLQPPAPDAEE